MEVLSGPALVEALRKKLHMHRGGKFAVAFWGKDAGSYLGFEDGYDLKIVCNLRMGGTNPAEIRNLQKHGVDIRHLDTLHAKVGIVGDYSFVGSSNMSINGLGDDNANEGWDEANVAFNRAEPAITELFEELWSKAKPLDSAALNDADAAWRARKLGAAKASAGRSGKSDLLDILRTAPETIDALKVFVVICLPVMPEDEEGFEAATNKVTSLYGERFELYSDWAELPKEGYFLSFERGAQGGLKYTGIYRRDPNFKDLKMPDYDYQAIYRVQSVDGLKFNRKDASALRQAIRHFELEGKLKKSEAVCKELSAFTEHLRNLRSDKVGSLAR